MTRVGSPIRDIAGRVLPAPALPTWYFPEVHGGKIAVATLLAVTASANSAAADGFAGGGGGVSTAYRGDGVGYGLRGFGWWTPSELALGMTGEYLVVPSQREMRSLTFLGLGLGFGPGHDQDSDTRGMVWLSLGAGYAEGACSSGLGTEIGTRLDQRVARWVRAGAGISFVVVGDGCKRSIDDSSMGVGDSSEPEVLSLALLVTLDLSFDIGANSHRP